MTRQVYFAEQALFPQGWKTNVRIEVENGLIQSLSSDANPEGATLLSGPTLPSLANLHSHAFQRAMAGMAEVSLNPNDSFWSWRDLMYKMVHKLTPDDVRIIATQLYIDMLKVGYTQVAEFNYLHHDPKGQTYHQLNEMGLQLARAGDQAGLGVTLLPVLYSHSGFGGQAPNEGQARFINSTEQYLALHQASQDSLAGHKLHKMGVCFHSLRAVTQGQIQEVLAELGRASNKTMPIHIHIAEQQKEVRDSINFSGQRPVQWLANEIGLDERWCLVHATHLDQNEVTAIAKSGAVAGLCPTTEANLGDGIFPGVDYIAQGGRWGIGSDSHVSLSLVEELRTLEYSQRFRDEQRNRLYKEGEHHVGDYLFQAARQGGNQACQVNLGLEIGNRADFMVLDNRHPFISASKNEDLLNRWLFATNENLIRHVYVAGNQVINDFKHQAEAQSNLEFTALLKRLFN
ncbi:N-formimino-L-glutamate deiminase [Marinomonas sp. SBI22]|uniref:formimidoylglutamate deiminase n=1 Tax=unclassified Marinomonas TaxID=196814 RepID=UPI0007AF0DB5|nr:MULTISPECIES: formimidoylglutamate deiminase [unclassified Marinomonas]KZM43011.1 N-formimino-L-glutamate deiminase [Marinomonas sp. SBI22]KZM44581.1 N-formimino-L-glutamate deiminase [Marinomonas sp. SBI8L]